VKYCLLIVVCLFSLFSCNKISSDNVLAKVNDEALLLEDVINELPIYITDTNVFIQNYINVWVREKALLNQALINLDENSKGIEEKVNNYKNSLLIYEYQQKLINQNFDTTVDFDEITDYYNINIKEFKLAQDVFKGRFIILDKNAPNLKSLFKMFKSNDAEEIDDLISYCMLYALEYYINDSSWSYFNSIKQKLPEGFSEKDVFYSKRKYDVIEGDKYLYLLLLKDFKFKGTTSPFSVEKEKIRSLIVNENKINYLNKIEENLVNSGKSSNYIKIY
jgi:hypothetical protein